MRIIAIVGLCLITSLSKAQFLLGSYNFSGAQGNEATGLADSQPLNGQLLPFTRGTGVTPPTGTATSAFGATGFTTATSIDTTDYFQFSVGAQAGFTLRLDSVVLSERRSNTGIRKWTVRSSVDQFTASLATFEVPDDALFRNNQRIPLGAGFSAIGGPDLVRFRLYGYEAEATTGTWRVDSVRVYGQITGGGGPVSGIPFTRTIAQVRGSNTGNVADSLGRNVRLFGTVYGHNQRTTNGAGYSLFFRDATGGISLFKTTSLPGLATLNEGDSVKVMGTINVFRGLSQIVPDSMVRLATGRSLKTPVVVTTLNEQTESDLVRVNGLRLVNPASWTTGAGTGGFTVRANRGTDTITIRIDDDCPLYNQAAPAGQFDIIGMGSQFTSSTTAPWNGGYQLIPRRTEDLIPENVVSTGVPFTRTIAQVRGSNTGNVADSLGRNVRLFGTVYGHNQRTTNGAGYSLFLRDATGGISLFKTTSLPGLATLNEGDSVKVMGTINVFRGLSQIVPDSMVRLATGRSLKTPVVVTTLNEQTESDLVRVNGLRLVNPASWTTGAGTGGFTVRANRGTDTITIRIDDDCPLYNQAAPAGQFDIIGMGSQFTSSTTAPWNGGYQLVPRRTEDLIPVLVNGQFSISPAVQTVREDSVAVTVNITLSSNPATATAIRVFARNGTATLNQDFSLPTSAVLTFPPGGALTQSLSFPLINDNIFEPTESFSLVLRRVSQTGDATIGADSVCTVTITDNDNPPTQIPTYTIARVRGNNSIEGGVGDSLNVYCKLQGTVHGKNQRPQGIQLSLIDATGGIGLFRGTNPTPADTLFEGDSIRVIGRISQFNGLTQMTVDSFVRLAANRPLKPARQVFALGEATESDHVFMIGTWVNPALWPFPATGAGFNMQLRVGAETITIRVDNDSYWYNKPNPAPNAGTSLKITGLGSQFTTTVPRVSGYQLLPGWQRDIEVLTSLSEPLVKQQLQLVPNPSNHQFFIPQLTGVTHVEVFDLQGKLHSKAFIDATTAVKISHLPAGSYLVRVAGYQTPLKFLKQ